jgi:tetratricopeptide (TPR) repeat protein
LENNAKEHRPEPRLWWMVLALAGITVALFSPLFHYDFINLDDPVYVTENPYVHTGLNFNSLAWAFRTSAAGFWFPMTWISHLLDFQCYGMKAGGHHLTNVLLHAANSVLLFLLLQRMTGAIWRSAVVAALFAWHPAHVESVAWVSEREDVLNTLFCLLSMWAYVRHTAMANCQWSIVNYQFCLSIVLFACALMSKPMAVTLPFVLLLLDFWPLGRMSRTSLPRLLIEKAPFLALSAACCAWTIWAQQRSHGVASAGGLPIARRLGHALASYLDYIVMLVFPHRLAIFYPYPRHEQMAKIIGGAAALVLLSVLAFRSARRRPWLMVGWLWFLGMLVPTIGLVQSGSQGLADRFTYLPSIGLFILLAWGGAGLALRFPAMKWLAPAVGLAMLAATWTQIHYWKDTRTVFERALQVTRNNYVALTLLGSLRADEGNLAGAIDFYRQALNDRPNYAEAHFYLARGLEQQGKADQAESEYDMALRIKPWFEQAHLYLGLLLAGEKKYTQAAAQYEAVLKTNPGSAAAHNDLGRLLQSEGRLDESLQHYLAAVQWDSSLAKAHNNLGVLYLQRGQVAEGLVQLRVALRLHPGNAETEYNLALALTQQQQWKEASQLWGRIAPARPKDANAQYQCGLALAHEGKTREALSQFASAILLKPDFAEALNELSWIISTDPRPEFRNGGEAIDMAERACQLTRRQQPAMLLTLAASYAEMGRFSDAMAAAKEGQDLAKAKGNKQLEAQAARMMEAFEKRQPFRQENQ